MVRIRNMLDMFPNCRAYPLPNLLFDNRNRDARCHCALDNCDVWTRYFSVKYDLSIISIIIFYLIFNLFIDITNMIKIMKVKLYFFHYLSL